MAAKISGVGAAAIGAGSVFLYAGIKGKSVLAVIQGVVQGKSPASAPQVNPISDTTAALAGSSSSSASSSAPGAPSVAGLYSHAQLMQLWQSVGGSAATANNAACHAIQESGGDPAVTSANPDGGTNVGLWQLDTPGGKGAGYTIAQLKNPAINARVALQGTSGGRDWSAWATPGC